MPAHLMGLLAIGTFYLVTVVIGMCATRCLTDEDDDTDDDGNKQQVCTIACAHVHEVCLQGNDGEDTLHLLRLLEHSLPMPAANNNELPQKRVYSSAATNTTAAHRTPISYEPGTSPLDLLSNHTTMSSFQRSLDTVDSLQAAATVALNGRAPRLAQLKTQSVDANTLILDTTVSPTGEYEQRQRHESQMTASRSMPISIGGRAHSFTRSYRPIAYQPSHLHTACMPPIVSGHGPPSPSSGSMCSSRPPPLPTGGRYLLADRNIGWIIGTLSMLAIKTGGVLPNAIAETTFRQGLLWCQLPLAAGCSVVVGGLLFARAMYSEGFLTVVDPFQVSVRACAAHMYVLQHVYGPRIGAFLFVPILIADLLYSCVIITSLAQLQTMVLGFDPWVAIVGSTVALLCYLLIGGFYAGTFTDSLQYIYLLIGLLILAPCLMLNDNYKFRPIAEMSGAYWGEVNGKNSGLYIDQFVMLILGGVPMQVRDVHTGQPTHSLLLIQSYFQRMFACRTPQIANRVTLLSAIGTLLTGLPAMFVGVAAHSIGVFGTNQSTQTLHTNSEWQNTTLQQTFTSSNATSNLVLDYALTHAVPGAIKMLALGALTSGLLASCDSVIFGLASIFVQNFYRIMWHPRVSSTHVRVRRTSTHTQADNARITWMTRLYTVLVTVTVTCVCLVWPHWHRHWMLPFDLLYVLVFPQLFCVVYFKYANSYGALAGMWTAVTVRCVFGEHSLGWPPLLRLPFYNETDGQLFPYRTLAMLANLTTTLAVSVLVEQAVRLRLVPHSQNLIFGRHTIDAARSRHSTGPVAQQQVVQYVQEDEHESGRRRRVNRFVSETPPPPPGVSQSSGGGGANSPRPSVRQRGRVADDGAPAMTITSLYRHAAAHSRRQSPLIERMTVL